MKLFDRLKASRRPNDSPVRIATPQLIKMRKDRDYLLVLEHPNLGVEDVERIRQALHKAFRRKIPMLVLSSGGELRVVEIEKQSKREVKPEHAKD